MRGEWTVNDIWMNSERIPNALVLFNKRWTVLLPVLHALKKRALPCLPPDVCYTYRSLNNRPLPYLPADWQLWNCFALRSSQSHVGSCVSHRGPWHEHLRRWRPRSWDRIKRAKHLLLWRSESGIGTFGWWWHGICNRIILQWQHCCCLRIIDDNRLLIACVYIFDPIVQEDDPNAAKFRCSQILSCT